MRYLGYENIVHQSDVETLERFRNFLLMLGDAESDSESDAPAIEDNDVLQPDEEQMEENIRLPDEQLALVLPKQRQLRQAGVQAVQNIAAACDKLNKTTKDGRMIGQLDGADTPESMSPEDSLLSEKTHIADTYLEHFRNTLDPDELKPDKLSSSFRRLVLEMLANYTHIEGGEKMRKQTLHHGYNASTLLKVTDDTRYQVEICLANSYKLDLFLRGQPFQEEDEVFLEEETPLLEISREWHSRRITSSRSSLIEKDSVEKEFIEKESSDWDHDPRCYDSSYTASNFLFFDSPIVWAPIENHTMPRKRTLSLTTVCSPRTLDMRTGGSVQESPIHQ